MTMTASVKALGIVDYLTTWTQMREFVATREPTTVDEIWLLQHPPVYTLGLAGKREHLLAPGTIPVLETDRGGQVTYHGPGQLIAYLLLDLKRLGIGPRELVRRIEDSVIAVLAGLGVTGDRRAGAPGVYVGPAKVAALGLRIRQGYSYHGVALNVAMDLEPFTRINPCGYPGLTVTSLAALGILVPLEQLGEALATALIDSLYPLSASRLVPADNNCLPAKSLL
ncbi:MAG: lipoyl(octanoyl) transferase LipB [Gammaproteobacteria bacterium]|nr:lipoyl(octanoyl) transferase LipB [Gammaproteobacteria bacterium]